MPLDHCIIHVFCLIDDIYHELFKTCKVRKGGYPLTLTDSEIITMLIVGKLLGISNSKKMRVHFKFHYLDYFPSLGLVKYKIFNKQATNLWQIIQMIYAKLLSKIGNWGLYLADGFPLAVLHLARARLKMNIIMALKFF